MSTDLKPAMTAAQIPDEWIDTRHAIIVRDGHATRPGPLHTIEVKSLRNDLWSPLRLPSDGYSFATAADRDAILKLLQEGK